MEKPRAVFNNPLEPVPRKKENRALLPFFGKETYYTSKIFKNTNLGIAYKTKYSISQFLKHKPFADDNTFLHSGVYQLTCKTVGKINIREISKLDTVKIYGLLGMAVLIPVLHSIFWSMVIRLGKLKT